MAKDFEKDLDSETEDLLPFNPMLQQLEFKFKQTETFSSDLTYKIFATLYKERKYLASAHVKYVIKSGAIHNAFLVVGRAAGGTCWDTDILKPGVVKSVIWTFGTPPFAVVDGAAAQIDQCAYGTNEKNWENTIRTKGITHVRVVVTPESQYIESQYRILPGFPPG